MPIELEYVPYNSEYTGEEIDAAINLVRSKTKRVEVKQNATFAAFGANSANTRVSFFVPTPFGIVGDAVLGGGAGNPAYWTIYTTGAFVTPTAISIASVTESGVVCYADVALPTARTVCTARYGNSADGWIEGVVE